MRAVAGGIVAIVLLLFYAYLVFQGSSVVDCVTTTGCTSLVLADFNDVEQQAVSVLGGLVSALIISELAITKQGEAPAARALAAGASIKSKNILRWVTGLYILVWLVTGAWAFLSGLNHPDTLPALTSVGQSWLGLSVASAYAYFGLNP